MWCSVIYHQQVRQRLRPLPPLGHSKRLNQRTQRVVESLRLAISLRMIRTGACLLNPIQRTYFSDQLTLEVAALIRVQLDWNAIATKWSRSTLAITGAVWSLHGTACANFVKESVITSTSSKPPLPRSSFRKSMARRSRGLNASKWCMGGRTAGACAFATVQWKHFRT